MAAHRPPGASRWALTRTKSSSEENARDTIRSNGGASHLLDPRVKAVEIGQAEFELRLRRETPPSSGPCRPPSPATADARSPAECPAARRPSRRRARGTACSPKIGDNWRQDGERIEQMMRENAGRRADRRQVVDGVPANQERRKADQLVGLRGRQVDAELRRAGAHVGRSERRAGVRPRAGPRHRSSTDVSGGPAAARSPPA